MNWFIAAWHAFPAAPETAQLRRLRRRSLLSLMVTALLIAWVHLLCVIHPFAVLIVPAVAIHAVVVTGRYWLLKNRADERYQADLGEVCAFAHESGESAESGL